MISSGKLQLRLSRHLCQMFSLFATFPLCTPPSGVQTCQAAGQCVIQHPDTHSVARRSAHAYTCNRSGCHMLAGTRKHHHITPILKSLNWLPSQQRIQFKILLLFFKALHGSAPQYISDPLTYYNSYQTFLVVPRIRSGAAIHKNCIHLKLSSKLRTVCVGAMGMYKYEYMLFLYNNYDYYYCTTGLLDVFVSLFKCTAH